MRVMLKHNSPRDTNTSSIFALGQFVLQGAALLNEVNKMIFGIWQENEYYLFMINKKGISVKRIVQVIIILILILILTIVVLNLAMLKREAKISIKRFRVLVKPLAIFVIRN